MKALLLILALAFTSSAQTLQAKVKTFKDSKRFVVKYDRFKDRTSVSVGPLLVRDWNLKVTAAFAFEGETQKSPTSTIFLYFVSSSGTWQFLDNRELFVLVDQERLALGNGERDGWVNSGYGPYARVSVGERLTYRVPVDVFEQIAKGSKVEMKIGRFETALKDEHLRSLRDFLSLTSR